jgi:hypothetical protein
VDAPSRRGPDPDDARLFSDAARPTLTRACAELHWLLDRGYPLLASIALVGNRHGLEARPREALRRVACTEAERVARAAKRVAWEAVTGRAVEVDGFNLLITLETAFGGGTVIAGRDGATRDLAGMRGSYRIVEATGEALDAIGRAVAEARPAGLRVWLDAPVSNSGRLRGLWVERAAGWPCPVELVLVPDADAAMAGAALAVSCDARVIDGAQAWCDLIGDVLTREGMDGRVLRFAEGATPTSAP